MINLGHFGLLLLACVMLAACAQEKKSQAPKAEITMNSLSVLSQEFTLQPPFIDLIEENKNTAPHKTFFDTIPYSSSIKDSLDFFLNNQKINKNTESQGNAQQNASWHLIPQVDWLNFNSLESLLYYNGKINNGPLDFYFSQNNQNLGPMRVSVLNDPGFYYQWHLSDDLRSLNNLLKTNQQPETLQTLSFQLQKAHKMGFTGRGIKIAIVDTGIQADHEDLKENYLENESRLYGNSPILENSPDVNAPYHGTGVAGLVAARGWNNKGIRGVAPRAQFADLAFLSAPYSASLLIDQVKGNFDIYNQSWGMSPNRPVAMPEFYAQALTEGVSKQRQGLGALYVKSAGNRFYACDYHHSCLADPQTRKACEQLSFCTENSNQDPYNQSPHLIVVGALNHLEKKSSYSSTGSNIWISAIGGENYIAYGPGLLTTDLKGCARGKSKNGLLAASYFSFFPATTDCAYTDSFSGTSAAAPVVSGAIALVLQANPYLSYRDVKYILARTAKKIDLDFKPWEIDVKDNSYLLHPGWIENKAAQPFHFHNWYGFGALDVYAAIQMSLDNYKPLPKPLPPFELKQTLDLTIPDENTQGLVAEFNLSQTFTVEQLEILMEGEHSSPFDLAVEITSPTGTLSQALNPYNSYRVSEAELDKSWSLKLISNAFYFEPALGIWQVRIMDLSPGHQGRVRQIKLKFYGF